MSMLDSHVVAYLPAKHRTHCAKLDPFGGACTCGATRVPLVRKSDADAAIAAARQAPATPAAQPADEREARVDPWYGRPMPRADFLRAALGEIADSKSLTATPTQFYQHLQRIACRALTADAKAEQSEPADEREAFEAWAAPNAFELLRDAEGKYDADTTADAWLAWEARAALGSQG